MITYQLKHLVDNSLIQATKKPVWDSGVWDCGSSRWSDPGQSLYQDATTGHDLMKPITFYLAFSVSERTAIKTSNDAIVKEFWAAYQLAASQSDELIDPDSTAIVGGLAYLAGQTVAPQPVIAAPIITAARIAQIQAGTPGGF